MTPFEAVCPRIPFSPKQEWDMNSFSRRLAYGLLLLTSVFLVLPAAAQEPEEPDHAPERTEGEGPYDRLILRGATLIDGTGAPPVGPVDIVVENDRIVEIESVGAPGAPIDADDRPPTDGGRALDLSGTYVLPGFVDMHGHQHTENTDQGVPVEYVHKLWMAHGITTTRDVGSGNGIDWLMEHKRRSAANEITAPRLEIYHVFGSDWDETISTPEQAREWVQWVADEGADGIKFFGAAPDIMEAALDEAGQQDLRTTMHHAQLDVTRMDALRSASLGLTSMEHWYGLPEALFTDRVVQDYPLDYNYNNEQHRFGEAGRLWTQAAEPYSERWNTVMDSLLTLDFTIVPTFVAYLASRDLSAQMRREWHALYTMPSLWDFYRPSRKEHGAYWFYWTAEDEMAWKENYDLWMEFINEYKNRGGRVGIGSDSGYIYNLYGFGYIQEMKLLREAGFHPLEVIRAATLQGAEGLGMADEIGSVEVGKKADFVVVEQNPLENLNALFGTGWPKLMDDGTVERVGGVTYTIKNGIVYDAKGLLEDVRDMVEAAKEEKGIPPGPMPMFMETDPDWTEH